MLKPFSVIVAKTFLKNGIGKNNNLPWKLKNDLKHFKFITESNKNPKLQNSIIMGKNTWNSLPKKPLDNRLNIIVSNTLYNENKNRRTKNIEYIDSFDKALNIATEKSENIFIIGGEQIYKEAINHNLCEKLYITDIYNNYNCDTYFPEINENKFKLTKISEFKKEKNINFRYLIYHNKDYIKNLPYKNLEELQLFSLFNNIIQNGELKSNRTNTKIYSVFSPSKLKYNLEDTFPICTSKKIFIRGIFEELMFILRGQTDNKILKNKKINIWSGNTTKEFLNSNNLYHLNEDDMGETYGFNMRYYGEKYINCNTEYKNTIPNSDQLNYLINLLKYDKNSRRMIINLWNPNSLNNCSLPPCLMLYQFNVSNNNKLNLQITLRSSDVYLANNWNTVYAALFVHLLCNIKDINLTPGILTVNIGDAHIYENHLNAVKEQMTREPRPYPKLEVLTQKKDITDFEFSDIKLLGYNPYDNTESMNVPMVV